jgi:transposase
VIAVAKLLKRHLENLLTSLRRHIANAVTEGLNSKIQSLDRALNEAIVVVAGI